MIAFSSLNDQDGALTSGTTIRQNRRSAACWRRPRKQSFSPAGSIVDTAMFVPHLFAQSPSGFLRTTGSGDRQRKRKLDPSVVFAIPYGRIG